MATRLLLLIKLGPSVDHRASSQKINSFSVSTSMNLSSQDPHAVPEGGANMTSLSPYNTSQSRFWEFPCCSGLSSRLSICQSLRALLCLRARFILAACVVPGQIVLTASPHSLQYFANNLPLFCVSLKALETWVEGKKERKGWMK